MIIGVEDWLLNNLADFQNYVLSAEITAARRGILQGIDPRIKIAGVLALIISAVEAKHLIVVAAVLALSIIFAALSRLPLRGLVRWVWLPVFLFTGPIAFPALFLSPGQIVRWHITVQGLRSAGFLILRAETATTLCALVAMTTAWPRILRALNKLGIPTVFLAILGSTQRYVFLLLATAAEMSEARRSRTLGRFSAAEKRRIAGSTIGVLLSRSVQLSTEVHEAMIARGFRGEIYLLDDFHLGASDCFWLVLFALLALAAFYSGVR